MTIGCPQDLIDILTDLEVSVKAAVGLMVGGGKFAL